MVLCQCSNDLRRPSLRRRRSARRAADGRVRQSSVADIQQSRLAGNHLSSFRVYLRRLATGYCSALDLNQEELPSPKAKVTK
jgi:hypothetical protein